MSNEGFEGLSEYSDLLENPQILNVIELSERQKGQLMKYIKQLETKDTTDWEDLQKPNNVPLTKNDVKTVWLRRVAVALYHEVNDTFPWKITDYKQEHLDLLLRLKIENAPKPLLESKTSMDFKEIGTDTYIFHNLVWSANPIQSMKIMQIIMKKYKPDTPQAALYSLIDYMCELGWVHFDVAKKIHNTDWDKLPYHTYGGSYSWGAPVKIWNYEAYFEGKGTGCPAGASVIRESMRAFNIPVIVGQNKFYHFGVYIPTLDLVMVHADDFFAYTFKDIPAKHSFRSVKWYKDNTQDSVCGFVFTHQKKGFIDWFRYYKHPDYGQFIKTQYCLTYKNQQGDLYNFMTKPLSQDCPQIMGDDPEIQEWLTTLDNYFTC